MTLSFSREVPLGNIGGWASFAESSTHDVVYLPCVGSPSGTIQVY